MTERSETYAIVGAGLAGAKAAETLREEGFDGRLVMIGEETHRPYERPPLSKDYLRGEADETPFVHDERFYAAREIELLTATRVSGIDLDASELLLGEAKEPLGFDRLLLATGSVPRRLDVPGGDLEGIHYLRTLDDSARIGEHLEPGRRLVVVGSGWIGAEVAASAHEKGCEVTMVETASLPLERVLGPEVGRIYLDLHREHGIEFLPETTVERFEGQGSVERVLTRDGALIDTDLVVVGIGVAPRTDLAQAAGLKLEDGVAVDEGLQTSAPGVFAAGDVASPWHPFYRRRLRVEHWANALNQGPAAARAMLGRDVTYDEIPYFFSDQYDVGMEYSGYTVEWDEVVFRGDPGAREFIAFWLEQGRVAAAMSMNVWDSTDQIRALIRSRRTVTGAELADPGTPISTLAAGAEVHALAKPASGADSGS